LIGVDKYTNFPSNTTVQFYCNTATCFVPLHSHRHAVKKKFLEKVNLYTNYTFNLFCEIPKITKKCYMLLILCIFLYSLRQPTYALNKNQ